MQIQEKINCFWQIVLNYKKNGRRKWLCRRFTARKVFIWGEVTKLLFRGWNQR